MPRYEQPPIVGEQQNKPSASLEHRHQRGLKQLAMFARSLVLGGMIGGLGAGGIRYGLEKVAETKYQAQFEQTADMTTQEIKIKELFGTYYPSANEMAKSIFEQKKRDPREGLRLLFGAKPDNLLANESAQEPETEQTERTLVGAIPTKEGQLDAMIVNKIVQETLPKGWLNNEVERIEYEDVEQDVDYEGIKNKALASCYGNGRLNNKRKTEIIFYAGSKRTSLDYVVGAINHEVAHANDWESDNEMTVAEKAALALKIGQRLKAKDRFMSSYVESIEYKNNKKKTRYLKATEYWAEICAQYFEDATRLNIKDYQIVDAHIRKTDPSFNWITAAVRRREITRQVAIRQAPPTETLQDGNPPTMTTQP